MNTIARDKLKEPFVTALVDVERVLGNSYCPCSGLCVAAGWVLEDKPTITGINYESASYGLTLCAERSALTRAQVKGVIRDGIGMVISASWRPAETSASPLSPCGACRQWLAELAQRLGRDFPVYSFWKGAENGIVTTARELLPNSFDMNNLSTSDATS